MASELIDYQRVIADLESKRSAINARFDAAVAAIRQVLALEGIEQQLALPEIQPVKRESAAHNTAKPFHGLGIVEAAFACLDRSNRPGIPNPELARQLVAGGFKHKSKDFTNTLNSVLRRRAADFGDIEKAPEGWRRVSKRQSDLSDNGASTH